MLDKFAEKLRNTRENNEITLQQMAAKTRIDIKFLEAIDNGNFSFLPNIYVRAFLKQYAKTVGLDEEETIKDYEAAKQGKLPEKNEVKEEKEIEEKKEEPDKEDIPKVKEKQTKPVQTFNDVSENQTEDDSGKKRKVMITGGSLIGMVVLVLLVYLLFFPDKSQIVVEERPYEEVLQETTQRYVEEESSDDLFSEVSTDSLQLQIINFDSKDTSWVLVISDNKLKEDYLLYPGGSKSFKAATNFKFTLGNSGVIRIRLNGENIEFEGRRKSVRHYKVDIDGLERLFSPPNLLQE